jgi:uncharacterized membrane protein
MSNGSGALLSVLLSYPALIMSLVVVVASVALLIVKRRSLSKTTKTLLRVLCAIAALHLIFLIYLMFAFGNAHPVAPPVAV